MQEHSDNTEEDDKETKDNEEARAGAPPHQWGSGSCIRKAPNIEQCHVFKSHLLFKDYQGNPPLYSSALSTASLGYQLAF